jgi:hypothetical protein
MKRRPVYLWLITAFLFALTAILMGLQCIRTGNPDSHSVMAMFICDGLAFFCAFMGLHNGKKEYF